MRRVDSLEKTLMLGGIGGRRKRGRQRMRWLDGITDSMDVSLSELRVSDGQGGLACCDSWGRRVRHDWATELNWRVLNSRLIYPTTSKSLHFRYWKDILKLNLWLLSNASHLYSELPLLGKGNFILLITHIKTHGIIFGYALSLFFLRSCWC